MEKPPNEVMPFADVYSCENDLCIKSKPITDAAFIFLVIVAAFILPIALLFVEVHLLHGLSASIFFTCLFIATYICARDMLVDQVCCVSFTNNKIICDGFVCDLSEIEKFIIVESRFNHFDGEGFLTYFHLNLKLKNKEDMVAVFYCQSSFPIKRFLNKIRDRVINDFSIKYIIP